MVLLVLLVLLVPVSGPRASDPASWALAFR